jgi:hypothetical protein
MIETVLTVVNAMHIAASVFINDEAGIGPRGATPPTKLACGEPLSKMDRTGENRQPLHAIHFRVGDQEIPQENSK